MAIIGSGVAAVSCTTPPYAEPRTPRPPALGDVDVVAGGLDGAEGIAIASDGRIVVSSNTATLSVIDPDGSIVSMGENQAVLGLALDDQGRVVLATNRFFMAGAGALKRFDLTTGETETLAERVEGRELITSNWPAIGPNGDIYCSHSTDGDVRNIGNVDGTGFVYRVPADGGAPSIVIDKLRGPNGLCFSENFEELFIAQTATGTVLRLTRRTDGSYGDAELWGPQLGAAPDNLTVSDIFDHMTQAERNALGHPDGLALDVDGNLYVVIPFANKVLAVTPGGQVITLLHDPDGEVLQRPTSIAFGGAGMQDLFITSMRAGSVFRVRSNIPGLRLPNQ